MVTIKGLNIARLGLVSLFFLQVFLPVSLAAAATPVGQVLLATGAATRQAPGSESEILRDRADIFSGDILETPVGALLQIKMVDDALLVLQSETSIIIHDYQYNPADPAAQAIRITLQKGRLRSVTGRAGESNHDAFRLNTPIAAIGIRGTDFETVTSAERTRVRLNSGAIVFAPLSDTCLAEALGPCLTDASLVLTEQLSTPVAELRANDAAPRLINLQEYPADSQGSAPPESREEDRLTAQQQAERVADDVQRPLNPGRVPPPPLENDQIHWGRWQWVTLQDIPLSADVKKEGREVLFTNDLFVLYRDQGFTSVGSGNATFNLYHADAALVAQGVYTPVSVTSGTLGINFNSQTFITTLNLSSAAAGSHAIGASGTVDSRGLFRGSDGRTTVLGALAGDSKQAGYLFTHALEQGRSIQGATQWVRP